MQIPYYTYHQNLQGIIFVHWNNRVFDRYDVYLGEHDGYKYYWSFEPMENHKQNRIFKINEKQLWVLDYGEDTFKKGVANEYHAILRNIHNDSVEIIDKSFIKHKRNIKHINPLYRALVSSIISSHSTNNI